MKIEVWSDFACPYCYIGKRRLETAIEQFDYKDKVELIFKSFELDPYAKKKYDESIYELVAKKYGVSVEESKVANEQIIAQAKELGLDFNFDDLKYTNTFDAHRLTHYAGTKGKMNEIAERILKAYFIESLYIANHDILAQLASEIGLDKERALEVLASDNYSKNVREDENLASRYGVSGVPYFVFNNKYSVSGAQLPEVFLQVLKRVQSEEIVNVSQESDTSNNGICIDGKCSIDIKSV